MAPNVVASRSYRKEPMFNRIRAIRTAMQAGWIASRCPNCIIDDANEQIIACNAHESRIAELARINKENN